MRPRLEWKSRTWHTRVVLIAGGVAVACTALAIAIGIIVSLADVGEPGNRELTPETTQESVPNSTTSTTSPSGTPTPTTPENRPSQTGGQSTESRACDLPVSTDRNACHDSYFFCALTAKAKVKAYYSGNGASLDAIAIRYAKSTYGTSLLGAWQAGYAGCSAALGDEYDRLYGGG